MQIPVDTEDRLYRDGNLLCGYLYACTPNTSRFEKHRPTYTWIFFNSTTLLHDLRLAESMDTELDTEELQKWRSNYKLKVDFQPCRGMALPTSHF